MEEPRAARMLYTAFGNTRPGGVVAIVPLYYAFGLGSVPGMGLGVCVIRVTAEMAAHWLLIHKWPSCSATLLPLSCQCRGAKIFFRSSNVVVYDPLYHTHVLGSDSRHIFWMFVLSLLGVTMAAHWVLLHNGAIGDPAAKAQLQRAVPLEKNH